MVFLYCAHNYCINNKESMNGNEDIYLTWDALVRVREYSLYVIVDVGLYFCKFNQIFVLKNVQT